MSNRRTPPSASGSRQTSPYSQPRPPAHSKCPMRLKGPPIDPEWSPPAVFELQGTRSQLHLIAYSDEFAEVKAVKLLRRGRRLQQVEAVYGKMNPEDVSVHHAPPPPAVIPKLKKEFFDSSFFRRFHVQKPILEPSEFRARYSAHLDGNPDCLPIPGQLIAMVLVVWAASFGVNESGQEIRDEDQHEYQNQVENVHDMLHEMLYLVDLHGIIRKPSWDGVKLLLLLLPLTQVVLSPMERLASGIDSPQLLLH
ncbi:hypothetical protein EIP91_008100 [Steccherinum ochraceum]|uniref:Uncharacterized protein n=1 Tax=Steccherinum ochraceum TaxID=92696 RepID=A0A4R0RDH8_9APHY|nr:hypothetical protein EIP91_008100 [Steccherinum ochraceum]